MLSAEHHLADAAWRAAPRSKLRWTRQARDGLAGVQAPGAEAAALGAYARPTWPPVLEQSAAKGSLDRTARSRARSHKPAQTHRDFCSIQSAKKPASGQRHPGARPRHRPSAKICNFCLPHFSHKFFTMVKFDSYATCSPESVDERTCHQSMVSQMLWLLLRRSSQSWPACNINSGWATQHHRSS